MDQAGTLDGVDPSIAKSIVESGLEDGAAPSDDKIGVSKVSLPAASLAPSQTTMVLEKSLGMALGMLKSGKIGGDLGALISKDKHILDGHHRWAATVLAAGRKGKVGGYMASLPGGELLKVLNVVSKGAFGVRNGKAGKGSISQFNPRNVQEHLKQYTESGLKGDHPISAKGVQDILEDNFGSVEEGIETMSKNVKLMNLSVPSWAPDRAQMPVIEPEQVPEAAHLLSEGKVDWTGPHKEAAVRLASCLPQGSRERRELLRALRSR